MDSILATFSVLGLPFAIIRPLVAFITGITGGYITARVYGEGRTVSESGSINDDTVESCALDADSGHRSFWQKAKAAVRYGFVDFIGDIAKWLTVGLLLAAVVSVLVPDNFIDVAGLPSIVQMLLVLLVSVPLYICATGSIPLAAVLIMKGLSPGAAFVLLMAGPATNMATITMIGKVMGRKTLVAYLSVIIAGALLGGLIIDYLLPEAWFSGIAGGAVPGMPVMSMVGWFSIVCGIVLAGLLLYSFIHRAIMSREGKKEIAENKNNYIMVKKFKVGGMSCNHCKANVEKGIGALDFVEDVKVDLATGSVMVSGEKIDDEKIKDTVESLGYTFGK
jgi:copper chaperone CopZ